MRLILTALSLTAVAAPAAAQSPYRAVGADANWTLTIDARTMRFEEPGARPVVVPRPAPQPSGNGERYVTRWMIVDTTRAHCTDWTTDRAYRDMVLVQVGRRSLRGCGGGQAGGERTSAVVAAKPVAPPAPVATASARPTPVVTPKPAPSVAAAPRPAPPRTGQRSIVTDTRWTVWQVNSRALQTERPMLVHFSGDLVEGRICNLFRGSYSLTGEQLQVGPVAARKLACPGPEMGAEATLFAMFRQPVRATVSRWGTLVLTSGRDVVTLRPVRR